MLYAADVTYVVSYTRDFIADDGEPACGSASGGEYDTYELASLVADALTASGHNADICEQRYEYPSVPF